MAPVALRLTINGQAHDVVVEPDRTLLEVLRTDLGLTGTKTTAWRPSAACARCCSTASP